VGVSRRRVGVAGLDVEGELYVNRRLRVGVDGGTRLEPELEAGPEPEAMGAGRVGDIGLRGEGGVTSVCSIELNIALACSIHSSVFFRLKPAKRKLTFKSIGLCRYNP